MRVVEWCHDGRETPGDTAGVVSIVKQSQRRHHASPTITHLPTRTPHHASPITHLPSRISHHGSPITHLPSRISHHASPITPPPRPPRASVEQLLKILHFAVKSKAELPTIKAKAADEEAASELEAPEGSVSTDELPGSLGAAAKDSASAISAAGNPDDIVLTGEAAEDAGASDGFVQEADSKEMGEDLEGGAGGAADDAEDDDNQPLLEGR